MIFYHAYGLTEVMQARPRSNIVITHGGNMGAGINDVRANFDAIYYPGAFDAVIEVADYTGSPDYLWVARANPGDFYRALFGPEN